MHFSRNFDKMYNNQKKNISNHFFILIYEKLIFFSQQTWVDSRASYFCKFFIRHCPDLQVQIYLETNYKKFKSKIHQLSKIHSMTQSFQVDIYDVLEESLLKIESITKIENLIVDSFSSEDCPKLSQKDTIEEEALSGLDSSFKKKSLRGSKNHQNRWNEQNFKKFWMFYLRLAIDRPYICISWYKWKLDSLFKMMAKTVDKTAKQCKSFDQRMRKQAERMNGPVKIDILDMAQIKLKEYEDFDQEVHDLLKQYQSITSSPSIHMKMLDQKSQKMKKWSEYIINIQNDQTLDHEQ